MTSPLTRSPRIAAFAGAALMIVGLLTACAGEPDTSGGTGGIVTRSGTGTDAAPSGTPTGGPASPTPSSTATIAAIPTDCRAILTEAVLAQLGTTPLNDAAFAPNGPQPDGTLICVWRDPQTDTTGLITTISRMSRGPALDMLNELADDEGFTCFTPDGGTRCEKTWTNPTYPVTDGRTLFWRDDVMIDTVFSNLAPSGYTAAIVASIFG